MKVRKSTEEYAQQGTQKIMDRPSYSAALFILAAAKWQKSGRTDKTAEDDARRCMDNLTRCFGGDRKAAENYLDRYMNEGPDFVIL